MDETERVIEGATEQKARRIAIGMYSRMHEVFLSERHGRKDMLRCLRP